MTNGGDGLALSIDWSSGATFDGVGRLGARSVTTLLATCAALEDGLAFDQRLYRLLIATIFLTHERALGAPLRWIERRFRPSRGTRTRRNGARPIAWSTASRIGARRVSRSWDS